MDDTSNQALPRRTFLRAAAGAAASVAVVGTGALIVCPDSASVFLPEQDHARASVSDEVRDGEGLGLRPGQELARWTVDYVHPVRHGSIRVAMKSSEGDSFEVDVLRRSPSALANAGSFGVFLINHGTGTTKSQEEQGCGAIMLARYLGQQEDAGLLTPPDELLSFDDRRASFPRREAGRRVS